MTRVLGNPGPTRNPHEWALAVSSCPPGSLGAWLVPSTLGASDGQDSEPSTRQGPRRKHQPLALTSGLRDLKGTQVGLRHGAWLGEQRLEDIRGARGYFSRCHRAVGSSRSVAYPKVDTETGISWFACQMVPGGTAGQQESHVGMEGRAGSHAGCQ